MKRALIIGASGGIGAALVKECAARSYQVTPLSRSQNRFDLTDPVSIDKALTALEGDFDLVLVATGALEVNGTPPEKTIKALTGAAMMDQFAVNTIGPALILRHAGRLLPRKRPSVIAVLSARVGSIGDNGIGGWVSYRAAKAAVNQVVRTSAIELTRSHPASICVSLHPGTVETAFTQKYLGRHPSVPPAQAAVNLLQVIESLAPEQSGQFFDWAGQEVPW